MEMHMAGCTCGDPLQLMTTLASEPEALASEPEACARRGSQIGDQQQVEEQEEAI